jgi:SsrA-binding protein
MDLSGRLNHLASLYFATLTPIMAPPPVRIMAKKPTNPGTIARNKKARFEYQLNEQFEAGVVLTGWEVKALRAGKGQLTDTYVLLKDGEAFLLGCNIEPLRSASTHVTPDAQRTRKLLLHRKELARLFSATQQKGQTCIPLAIFWKGNKVKCSIALAVGKKEHDKRAAIKDRDWKIDKQRLMKEHNR